MLLSFSGNVYFTGFMATGKSRVGSMLAQRLQRPFVDVDVEISKTAGLSISEIFAQEGEAGFRLREMNAIRDIAKESGQIVALGGGALNNPGLVPLLRSSGLLVRLWANPEVLSERIGRKNTRPLLADLSDEERLERIKEMLAQREPLYAQADFAVESSDRFPMEHVCSRVVDGLRFWARRRVLVQLSQGASYPIFIGNDYLHEFGVMLEGLKLNTSHEFLVCTDSAVASAQEQNLLRLRNGAGGCRVFQFQNGEINKNLTSLNRLYSFLLRRGYGRRTCLLQFGGGVVGDMAGFGAATYQRGLPFIQIPTTLLAMVDSSVGGKVAVNHPEGKNMIGAFYQPRAVVVDLSVLNTLPKDELLSGLAEVVKYGVIYDGEFFAWLEENASALLARNAKALEYAVRRSCEIKAEVVGIDELENGLRAILNFGHTFGHALEKITGYRKFSHGLAVALGMRVECRLATLMGLWNASEELRVNNLLDNFGLPKYFVTDKEKAWQAMGVDKKVEKSKRVVILPRSIGKVEKVQDPPRSLVDKAWDAIAGGTA